MRGHGRMSEADKAVKQINELWAKTYTGSEHPITPKAFAYALRQLGEEYITAFAMAVNAIGDWDGRISCKVRAWAREISNGMTSNIRLVMHSVHIDQTAWELIR